MGTAVTLMHDHYLGSLPGLWGQAVCKAGAPGCSPLWGVGYLCRKTQVSSKKAMCAKRQTVRLVSSHSVGKAKPSEKKILHNSLPPPASTTCRQRHSVNRRWVSELLVNAPVLVFTTCTTTGAKQLLRQIQYASMSCCPIQHPWCIRVPNRYPPGRAFASAVEGQREPQSYLAKATAFVY